MEVIKQLENMARLQDELDSGNILNYYNGDYSKFGTFIYSVLDKSPEREQNAKELVEHLDSLWKYTDYRNNEWLCNPMLLKQDGYIDKLIDNIDKFKFKDKIVLLLFGTLYYKLNTSQEELNRLCQPRLYNKLLSINLDEKDYKSVFTKIGSEREKDFIKAIVDGGYKIDFSDYPIHKENKNIINDNIDYLGDVCNNLFGLRRRLIEKDNDIDNLNVYMDLHFDKTIESLLDYSDHVNVNNHNIRDIVKLIIKDVMTNEEATFKDVKVITTGAFSLVVIIKDKVIKLGNKRANKNFSNIPYIIKPLLRKTIKDGNDSLFVEVTERVETLDYEEVKNNPDIIEEMYNLYKKLRDLGMVWTDVNYRNVGRLIKDNIIHWKSNIEPSSEVLEFTGNKGDELLKKGDLVILDADHIYDENTVSMERPESELKMLFDRKYALESGSNNKKQKNKGFTSLQILELVILNMVFSSSVFLTYIFLH